MFCEINFCVDQFSRTLMWISDYVEKFASARYLLVSHPQNNPREVICKKLSWVSINFKVEYFDKNSDLCNYHAWNKNKSYAGGNVSPYLLYIILSTTLKNAQIYQTWEKIHVKINFVKIFALFLLFHSKF